MTTIRGVLGYRKSHEVTGYAADADVWCIDCANARYFGRDAADERDGYLHGCDNEGNLITPVFLSSEWDCPLVCNACGDDIDCTVIPVRDRHAFSATFTRY